MTTLIGKLTWRNSAGVKKTRLRKEFLYVNEHGRFWSTYIGVGTVVELDQNLDEWLFVYENINKIKGGTVVIDVPGKYKKDLYLQAMSEAL